MISNPYYQRNKSAHLTFVNSDQNRGSALNSFFNLHLMVTVDRRGNRTIFFCVLFERTSNKFFYLKPPAYSLQITQTKFFLGYAAGAGKKKRGGVVGRQTRGRKNNKRDDFDSDIDDDNHSGTVVMRRSTRGGAQQKKNVVNFSSSSEDSEDEAEKQKGTACSVWIGMLIISVFQKQIGINQSCQRLK